MAKNVDTGTGREGRLKSFSEPARDRLPISPASAGRSALLHTRYFSDKVLSLAFSPDGTRLACAVSSESLQLWNASSWELEQTLPVSLRTVAFSGNGRWLAGGSYDHSLILWSVPGYKQETLIDAHKHAIVSLAFSPDSQQLASGSFDGTVAIWGIPALQRAAVVDPHHEEVRSVAFSPVHNIVAGAAEDSVHFWEPMGGKPIGVLESPGQRLFAIAFSPDGNLLAAGGKGVVELWHTAEKGKPISFSIVGGSTAGTPVRAVGFSPDGRQLAAGGDAGILRLWDVASRRALFCSEQLTANVTALAFSVISGVLVSAHEDGIRIWNTALMTAAPEAQEGAGARSSGPVTPAQPTKRDFFISYTKADKNWATWIAWILEDAGYTVIIQAWDFPPGSHFVQEMDKALQQSDRTLLVLSDNFLRSDYARAEFAVAWAGDPTGEKRQLIPIRVGHCNPEGLLKIVNWVDIVDLPEPEARMAILGAFGERAKPHAAPPFPGHRVAANPPNPPNYPGTSGPSTHPRIVEQSNLPPEARTEPAAEANTPMSTRDRIALNKRLNALPAAMFNMLLFAVDPPPGFISPMPAAQVNRTDELLNWAQGPGGCGLRKIQETIEDVSGT